MSNRGIFAIMAVVGIGAIVGLYLLVRGDGDAASEPTAKGSGSAQTTAARSGDPSSTSTPQPALPETAKPGRNRPDTTAAFQPGGERDHRTGTRSAPFETDVDPQPPNRRRLEPTLTKAIADRVRDVMHDCVKSLPADARGERPRLEGSINIAIKSKQVSINRADLVVKDVTGDAAAATQQCIVQKSMSISQAAGDEADMESYDITLSFTLI